MHSMSYNTYLIRLWQDTPDGSWRASAQSIQGGEITRFGSLQALFAFLETETKKSTESNKRMEEGDSYA